MSLHLFFAELATATDGIQCAMRVDLEATDKAINTLGEDLHQSISRRDYHIIKDMSRGE